jgi:uncharacterized repeat protein (TIGR01451 family)
MRPRPLFALLFVLCSASVVRAGDLQVGPPYFSNTFLTAGAAGKLTFSVSNSKTSSNDVSVKVDLPPEFRFSSVVIRPLADWVVATLTCATPAVGSSGSVTCTAPVLPSGYSATIEVAGTIDAATPESRVISATTSGTTTATDNATTNDGGSGSVTVIWFADLAVTVDAPTTANAGEPIVYAVRVTNNGPGLARNVSLHHELRTLLSLSADDPSVICQMTGTSDCSIAALAPGHGFTMTARRYNSPQNGAGLVIPATFLATMTNADGEPSNDTATVRTTDSRLTDAYIEADPPAVASNGDVTIKYRMATNGPSSASGAAFTYPIPQNATFVAVTAGNVTSPQFNVNCAAPAAGGTGTVSCATNLYTVDYFFSAGRVDEFPKDIVEISVTVRPAAGATLSHHATISSQTPDSNPANNSVGTTTAPSHCDLSVTVTADHTAARSGDTIVYTFTVHNAGPDTATDGVLTGFFSNLATVVSTAGMPCSASRLPLTCGVPALAAGADAQLFVTTTQTQGRNSPSPTTFASGTVLSANDTNSANNSNAVNLPLELLPPRADVRVGVAADQTAIVAGDTVVYSVIADDTGPQPAKAITTTITLPVASTLVSVSAVRATCSGSGPIVCIGDLPLYSDYQITITTTQGLAATPPAGGYKFVATVSGSFEPPYPGNTTREVPLQVNSPSSPPATDAWISLQGPSSIAANESDVLSMMVVNEGPAALKSVVATMTLSGGATFESAPAGCTISGTKVTCTSDPLFVWKSNSFLGIRFRAPADTATVVVTATLSAANDNTPQNNSATKTIGVAGVTPLPPRADVRVAVSTTSQELSGASVVVYVVVRNDGPQASPATTLDVTLPAGFTIVSTKAPGSTCTPNGAALQCTLPAPLQPSTEVDVTITARADGSGGTISASVQGSIADPDPSNNSASATMVVTPTATKQANLHVDVNAPPTVVTNALADFHAAIRNYGGSTSTMTSFTLVLPAGFTLVSFDVPASNCSEATAGTLQCSAANALAAGASLNATITARAGATAGGGTFRATVQGALPDPDVTDNSASAATAIVAPPPPPAAPSRRRTSGH